MRHLRFILLFFAMSGISYAHLGFENDTEIRVFPDRMRVVIRTSIPFAQALLGAGAPLLTNESGQAAAKLLLEKSAAELISITSGGNPTLPLDTDCLFEVQDDVAFILTFPRPSVWPVVVKAEFFSRFGNLETGTMAAFDCTASRFSREVEPFQKKIIDPRNPSLTFSLGVADLSAESEPDLKPTVGDRTSDLKKTTGIFSFLTLAGGVAYLAHRSWRNLIPKA